MAGLVQYPQAGCIVEYFEANAPQIGVVTEESGGKLRLLLPNRRETKLASARVLPWMGPLLPGFAGMSRDEAVKALQAAQARRDEVARAVSVEELWEMAQGEVSVAPALWFAELFESDPGPDEVAGYAHALLGAKTRFRFAPPNFEVYTAEQQAQREEERRRQKEREALLAEGVPFVRTLWNVAQRKCALPRPGEAGWPGEEVAEKLERLLFQRMADPESTEDDALWKMLIKGVPEVPHVPVQLLEAWGKVPCHYNFWFDRAGFVPGDGWWGKLKDEVDAFVASSRALDYPDLDLPFVSIDGETTRDVDDAFWIAERPDGGTTLSLALACPGGAWPFGSRFDRAVLHRGTSIYLPEGDSHMMPESIGTDALSLVAGQKRPALVVTQNVAPDGSLDGECRIEGRTVTLAANLRYEACQKVLDGTAPPDSPALPYEGMLQVAKRFAEARLAYRIALGAVVLERKEPKIVLSGEGEDTVVDLKPGENAKDAQNLVAEMMILASAACAGWAQARNVPMLYRTQDVALPKEYAGVWSRPEEVSKIMRSLVPSILDTEPRPHAALGLPRYAPMTSPLRRYADLVNEAQLLSQVLDGAPRFSQEELQEMLLSLRISLDGASQIQRFRPRYWKCLYFRQQGDRIWWPGVVTEENELFVSVNLPEQDIFVRGKRRVFDERTCPGMPVEIRIGKVNPLYNEMQILEACAAEGAGEEEGQC